MCRYKQYIIQRSKSFARACEGIAAVEFALMLPIMMLLFMGGVEVARYILAAQKVEKAAVTISDLVAQSQDITAPALDVMVLAAEEVMQPFNFDTDGYVIISSISRVGSGTATVNWQYTGGGTWNQTSQLGAQGETALLPSGFTLDPNEGVIIAEVFYNFSPMVSGFGVLPENTNLYKIGVFKPRLGELTTLGS